MVRSLPSPAKVVNYRGMESSTAGSGSRFDSLGKRENKCCKAARPSTPSIKYSPGRDLHRSPGIAITVVASPRQMPSTPRLPNLLSILLNAGLEGDGGPPFEETALGET